MFTGIIESMGRVLDIDEMGGNKTFTLEWDFTHELKVDQSIAHNGVCLTVTNIDKNTYRLTAIDETLKKTNLNHLKIGDAVNLERCVKLGDRLDGHMVQGHVDHVGKLVSMENKDGSWVLGIQYDNSPFTTVKQGSICVNGISLTVAESEQQSFKVAIIPYTYEHTNLKNIKIGDAVNLEFDILGKYIQSFLEKTKNS